MQEGMDEDLERERKRKYLAYQREYRRKAKAAKQKKEKERIQNLVRVRRHRAKRKAEELRKDAALQKFDNGVVADRTRSRTYDLLQNFRDGTFRSGEYPDDDGLSSTYLCPGIYYMRIANVQQHDLL